MFNEICFKVSRSLFVLLLSVAISTVSAEASEADNYPNKPVEMLIAYGPGAATDAQARPLLKYFKEEFGQPLVIQNISGAGGSTGWNKFVKTKKHDGYLLAVYNIPNIIAKPIVEQTLYTWKDFRPVAHWVIEPTCVGVLPDSQFNSMKDLVDYARANPGKLTAGTSGLYIGQHFAILKLQQQQNLDISVLPFDSCADAQAAILGNQIKVNFGHLADMYRLGDRIKILGIAAPERHEYLPNVPTLIEQGYDILANTGRGIAVHRDTPQPIVDKLEAGFMKIMNSPEYQADMKKLGAPLHIMNAKESQEHITEYAADIEQILKNVGELNK